MKNRDYGKVRYMADGDLVGGISDAQIAEDASDKAAGLAASNADREAGLDAGRGDGPARGRDVDGDTFFGKIKKSLGRFAEGNIDDPNSVAYAKYGAGRGKADRFAAEQEAKSSASKADMPDYTNDTPAPPAKSSVEQDAATSGRDNDGPGTVSDVRSSAIKKIASTPAVAPAPKSSAPKGGNDAVDTSPTPSASAKNTAAQSQSYSGSEMARLARNKAPAQTKTQIASAPKRGGATAARTPKTTAQVAPDASKPAIPMISDTTKSRIIADADNPKYAGMADGGMVGGYRQGSVDTSKYGKRK